MALTSQHNDLMNAIVDIRTIEFDNIMRSTTWDNVLTDEKRAIISEKDIVTRHLKIISIKDLDIQNNDGNTALMLTIINLEPYTGLQILKKYDAMFGWNTSKLKQNLKIKNKDGNTAIMLAFKYYLPEINNATDDDNSFYTFLQKIIKFIDKDDLCIKNKQEDNAVLIALKPQQQRGLLVSNMYIDIITKIVKIADKNCLLLTDKSRKTALTLAEEQLTNRIILNNKIVNIISQKLANQIGGNKKKTRRKTINARSSRKNNKHKGIRK